MERSFRNSSGLDQVRIRQGTDACRAAFQIIYDRDRKRAAMLLNDRRLTFPTLYILSPQIDSAVYPCLREHLVVGLGLIARVRGEATQAGRAVHRDKNGRAALRWILDTGYTQDGLDEEYEEVLERAISLLINTYHDTDILPRVADMIFARHREGRNIHDLTWAYFQSGHPGALTLIARRLSSKNPSDIELACRLLHIDTPGNSTAGCGMQYHPYLRWLRDNDPYLYFTGESMQYASEPAYYRIDPERKYMQRGTPAYHREPVALTNDNERECLAAFTALPDAEKDFLAEHSHWLHAKDIAAWRQWMHRPIEEQIRTARAEGEGSL